MARLEIPSIVVHNGSSAPGSPSMEAAPHRTNSLDKQVDGIETSGAVEEMNHQCGSGVDAEEKPPPVARLRSHSKVKLLVRSHAVREEASPPPDPGPPLEQVSQSAQQPQQQPPPQQPLSSSTDSLRPASRPHKLRHQGSSQGSGDSCPSPGACLSRDSSTEQAPFTDSSGVDLQAFLTETLNGNPKDRVLLLRVEHDLVSLARDSKRSHYKFPPMSSYQRMLVHRTAAYFGMEHNVDPTGSAVIVNRTPATRLPETRFREHLLPVTNTTGSGRSGAGNRCCPSVDGDTTNTTATATNNGNFGFNTEEPRRSILKRDSASFEDTFKEVDDSEATETVEQADAEDADEGWPQRGGAWDSSSGSVESDHLLRPCAALRGSGGGNQRLLKVESFEGKDTLKANSLRLAVSKSYSFGGYPGAPTASDCAPSQGSRMQLSKQDSGSSSLSSRLSPSTSSGYKSQSQRSDTTLSATPSPTATPTSSTVTNSTDLQPTVMWAVTSMASVPPGSVLINPQTGRPLVNADGSIYRWDPSNPPHSLDLGELCNNKSFESPEWTGSEPVDSCVPSNQTRSTQQQQQPLQSPQQQPQPQQQQQQHHQQQSQQQQQQPPPSSQSQHSPPQQHPPSIPQPQPQQSLQRLIQVSSNSTCTTSSSNTSTLSGVNSNNGPCNLSPPTPPPPPPPSLKTSPNPPRVATTATSPAPPPGSVSPPPQIPLTSVVPAAAPPVPAVALPTVTAQQPSVQPQPAHHYQGQPLVSSQPPGAANAELVFTPQPVVFLPDTRTAVQQVPPPPQPAHQSQQPEAAAQVHDLSGYFMGLSVSADVSQQQAQQPRASGAGDATGYPPMPTYWSSQPPQRQQAPPPPPPTQPTGPTPTAVYYMPATPVQVAAASPPAATHHRYLAAAPAGYPQSGYPPAGGPQPDGRPPGAQPPPAVVPAGHGLVAHSGGYVTAAYPVATATYSPATATNSGGGGECPVPTLYQPLYYSHTPAAPAPAPTPPHTPTQTQALCHPAGGYVYLNGGYGGPQPHPSQPPPPAALFNGGAAPGHLPPPPPPPPHHLLPSLHVFPRSGMQMLGNVRSSPPPPPRGRGPSSGAVSSDQQQPLPHKGVSNAHTQHRPAVGTLAKDSVRGSDDKHHSHSNHSNHVQQQQHQQHQQHHHHHHHHNHQQPALGYPTPLPLLGLRFLHSAAAVPGDMRLMGAPLSAAPTTPTGMRIPFSPIGPPTALRMPLGETPGGSGRPPRARKPRSGTVCY